MSSDAPTPTPLLTLGPASPEVKAPPSSGRGPMPFGSDSISTSITQATSSSSVTPWAVPSTASGSEYSQSDLGSVLAGCSSATVAKADLIVIGSLGCGTYGRVDKVKRKIDGKICVCKEVSIEQFTTDKDRMQALSEAKIMCGLRCPYIVEFLDAFLEGSCLYILIQYCERGDLARYLRKASVMPDSSIWRIFLRIARALEYLHKSEILHRDVKSANVFLAYSDEDVRLGDFGQSKQMQPGQKGCSTIVGSPSYMAPEQVSLPGHYDEKCDAWALGIILYELCSSNHKSPFSKARNITDLMRAIVNDDVPPLPKHITEPLKEVSNAILDKDDKRRPSVIQLFALRTVNKHARTHKVFEPAKAQLSSIRSDSTHGGGVAPARQGCCACLARAFGLQRHAEHASRNDDEPEDSMDSLGAGALSGAGALEGLETLDSLSGSGHSSRSPKISPKQPHLVIYSDPTSAKNSLILPSPSEPSSLSSPLVETPIVDTPSASLRQLPSNSSAQSRDVVLYNDNDKFLA